MEKADRDNSPEEEKNENEKLLEAIRTALASDSVEKITLVIRPKRKPKQQQTLAAVPRAASIITHERKRVKEDTNMEISMKITYRGTKLQAKRKERGLSQSQLATASEVNIRTLQKYEIGEKDLNSAKLSTLLRLCIALECRLIDILNDPETVQLLETYGAR